MTAIVLGLTSTIVSAWELEAGHSADYLDGGYADWKADYLQLSVQAAADLHAYGVLRRQERFGLRDQEGLVGANLRLQPRLALYGELSHGATPQVVPENSLLLGASIGLGSADNVFVQGKRSQYARADVQQWTLGWERYAGQERWSLAGNHSAVAGQSGVAMRGQWDHYYGQRSQLGLLLARGEEVESLGSGQFLRSTVTAVVLLGVQELGTHWALRWEVGRTRQGELYTREGWRLGVLYSH